MNNKDELFKIILDQQERNIQAFEGVKNALQNINDFNVLHATKEGDNYMAIKNLISSNKSVVSILQWVIVAVVSALIVLAGAGRVLEFLPFLGK
ncbi:MAG: hypothetical protein UT94_C0063G0007 [Candidatus Uhrbacteria bacterium GW2011_GWF2_40_263]|nr:MAG: hypothetical protein UT94_C0063G0007 [Candidatus Uhrbacteria bacterium GW2011_GWF2_40_263]